MKSTEYTISHLQANSTRHDAEIQSLREAVNELREAVKKLTQELSQRES